MDPVSAGLSPSRKVLVVQTAMSSVWTAFLSTSNPCLRVKPKDDVNCFWILIKNVLVNRRDGIPGHPGEHEWENERRGKGTCEKKRVNIKKLNKGNRASGSRKIT